MNIAIIGAGFAGLGAAYYLLESGANVTLFDKEGVGAGASSVCSGLLHPYPGMECKRSLYATEAIECTKKLLELASEHTNQPIAQYGGIYRKAVNATQVERLKAHANEHKDVLQIGDDLFLIKSGITVHSKNYMEGLFAAIEEKGVKLIIQGIQSLLELESFDRIVIAAGYGVRTFPEVGHIKVQFLKGQALHVQGNPPMDKSFLSKGYIAYLGSNTEYELGSTYEREFENDAPNLEKAKELLKPQGEILSCKAAVRVCMQGHYLPIIQQVNDKTYVFTGLGSRGLLYHAYFGKKLAEIVYPSLSEAT